MTNFLSGKKKIITMILGVVSGIAIAFGLDQNEVSTIAGAVVSVISVAGYLLAEGKIDVERIKNAAESVNDAIEIIEGIEDTEPVRVKGFGAETEAEGTAD